ncbi:short-chain dehydrogenase [Paenibacillus sp. J23TS9]|uniref:SDR family NAD(P)-dependent oxidoreductase n=1 Tax=Paenibacillus sp. J23TS9 TaxID=2807193 RepID=UPI001B0C57A4|nr:SDR family oxidoreductase [Paenibacillus sp. J23TS9]GIP25654.1 short-chain dehydrogenase [Paenibacillus sp. J23TS9]
MVDYKGKVALVTGASTGIGKAYASELAAKGSHVIVVARSKDKLETLAKELSSKYGIKAYALPADLSKPGAVRLLAEQIAELGLNVNILINNAGFGTHGRFEEISSEREQEMISLNVASLVDMTHQFLPYMQQQKNGIIVNVASLGSFQSIPYMATYAATKAFVLSFTESVFAENRHLGVRVLALCPGTTKTEFFDVIGTTEMPGGINGTPKSVVKAGFRGIEKGRSYIIDGTSNYWLAQSVRFLTRKFTVIMTERMTRPASSKTAASIPASGKSK